MTEDVRAELDALRAQVTALADRQAIVDVVHGERV